MTILRFKSTFLPTCPGYSKFIFADISHSSPSHFLFDCEGTFKVPTKEIVDFKDDLRGML